MNLQLPDLAGFGYIYFPVLYRLAAFNLKRTDIETGFGSALDYDYFPEHWDNESL